MIHVREGTLKYKVLELIQECGILPRQDIGFSFRNKKTGQVRTDDRSMRFVIRELIDQNYIAVYHKVRNYCYITKEGWLQLNKIQTKQLSTTGLPDYKMFRKSTFDRQVMVGETINLCHAAGFGAFPSEKPHLSAIIKMESEKEYPEFSIVNEERYLKIKKTDVELLLKKGIFYQSKEVKELLRLRELEDFTGYSRFVGIILTTEDVYIVYNTLDRLIRWYATAEARTIRCLFALFSDCERYQNLYLSPKQAKIIVLGQGDCMVPALVTGHKYGHVRSNSGNGTVKHPLHQLHASMVEASHFFLIPTTKEGIIHLNNAVHLSEKSIIYLNQIQVKKNSGKLLYTPISPHVQLRMIENGIPAALMLWYDIKQLHWIRENIGKIHIITYPKFLPHISKSLGTTLESASHAKTGEPLDFFRYDNFGEKINNNHY